MIGTKTRFSFLKIEDESGIKEENVKKEGKKNQSSVNAVVNKAKKKKVKNATPLDNGANLDFITVDSQLMIHNEKELPIKEEAFKTITKKRGTKKQNALSLSQFCSIDNSAVDFSKKGKWTSDKPLSSLLTGPNVNKEDQMNHSSTNKNMTPTVENGIQFLEIINLTKENSDLKSKLQSSEDEKSEVKKQLVDLQDKNAKLTILFENAQMKEKAELMIQIEELLTFHNDLSKEISGLNADIEREKCKTHQAESLVKSLRKQMDELHLANYNHPHLVSTNSHHTHHNQSSASAHHSNEQSAHHHPHAHSSTTTSHKYQRGHIK